MRSEGKMNIYDIAQKAGVSIATVSRVLNGNDKVSAKTRDKVNAVIAEMGYTPNIFARGLGLNSIKMVGVICTDVSDIYYAKAVSVLEECLRQNGLDAILCCVGTEIENKKKSIEMLINKRVDAIILIGSVFKEKDDNCHIKKAAKQLPVIMINALVREPNVYCVLSDEYHAMRHMVKKLIQNRTSQILYLYDVDTPSSHSKLSGFKQGFKECDRTIDNELIVKVPHDLNEVYEVVEKLLDEGLQFSAVIASEDLLAIGALKAIRKKAIKVPDEIAVIGFNNSILAECSSPQLTSIDNKVSTVCSTAVSLLKDVLEEKNVPHTITIETDLFIRETYQL